MTDPPSRDREGYSTTSSSATRSTADVVWSTAVAARLVTAARSEVAVVRSVVAAAVRGGGGAIGGCGAIGGNAAGWAATARPKVPDALGTACAPRRRWEHGCVRSCFRMSAHRMRVGPVVRTIL